MIGRMRYWLSVLDSVYLDVVDEWTADLIREAASDIREAIEQEVCKAGVAYKEERDEH